MRFPIKRAVGSSVAFVLAILSLGDVPHQLEVWKRWLRAVAEWSGVNLTSPAAMQVEMTAAAILIGLWAWDVPQKALARFRLKSFPVPNSLEWDAFVFQRVDEKSFNNEVVHLDGREFHNCTFSEVTFNFAGTAPFRLLECRVIGSSIVQSSHSAIQFFGELSEKLRAMPQVHTTFVGRKNVVSGMVSLTAPPQVRVPPPG